MLLTYFVEQGTVCKASIHTKLKLLTTGVGVYYYALMIKLDKQTKKLPLPEQIKLLREKVALVKDLNEEHQNEATRKQQQFLDAITLVIRLKRMNVERPHEVKALIHSATKFIEDNPDTQKINKVLLFIPERLNGVFVKELATICTSSGS